MKTNLLILVFLILSSQTYSQILSKEKLTRQEKKVLRLEKATARELEVAQLLRDTLFVLEPTRVNNAFVNPNLYFIAIEKEEALIQTGLMNETHVPRLNGLTIEGRMTNMKFKKSKNGKSTSIRMIMVTSLGRYQLDFRITAQGQTTATLRDLGTPGNLDRLEFKGTIIPVEQSNVFVGGPIY